MARTLMMRDWVMRNSEGKGSSKVKEISLLLMREETKIEKRTRIYSRVTFGLGCLVTADLTR